jgi:protein-disulfide isomerase
MPMRSLALRFAGQLSRVLLLVMSMAVATSVRADEALAVDVQRLSPEARDVFNQMVREEVCPCDCPKTLGQCLLQDSQCTPAVALGDWMVDQLSDGAGASLGEAVTKEVGAFASKPKVLVEKGYASKGSPKAAITIVEYADFECGHCKAAVSVMEQLLKRHPEVRVVYKHMPLSMHPLARVAAIAAEAAGKQGKFWEMHGAIFATQESLSEELIVGHAKGLGLDMTRFAADRLDAAVIKRVDDGRAEAIALGIAGTPAFFVNGRPYHLNRSVDGFETRLRMEAARATASCK